MDRAVAALCARLDPVLGTRRRLRASAVKGFRLSFCTLSIHLKPRSKREGIVSVSDERIEIAVHAPPVGGKANDAMIGLLADALDVPKSAVELLRGATSRCKIVRIAGMAAPAALELLRRLIGR